MSELDTTNQQSENVTFGERIKALRMERDWTLHDVARRMKTNYHSIYGYEKSVSTPRYTTVIAFAEVFGMTPDELMAGVAGKERRVSSWRGW